MILVVFLALIAHVSYALNDFSGAVATRKFGGREMSLLSWLTGTVIYIPLLPFCFHHTLYLWPSLAAFFTGILFAIAYPLFLKAMEKGNATLGGVIAGTFPLWVVILSVIFYSEHLTPTEVAIIALILAGIILSALHLTRATRIHNLLSRYSLLALGVSVLWGIGFAIFKYPVEKIGWFEAAFLNSVAGSLTSMAWLYPRVKGKLRPLYRKYYRYPVANAITGISGTLAYGFALTRGNASLVAPIAGSYGGLFAIISYLKFKEKLTKLQILGVVVILIGIISLSTIVARS